MPKQKFYVVWKGKIPGIYHTWDECKAQTFGFQGAAYKSFASEIEAKKAFASSPKDCMNLNNKTQTDDSIEFEDMMVLKPIMESISVDAACSGNPGTMEYRGVNTLNGEEIFRQGPYKNATNNIGEFLALVHGLALLKKQNSPLPIYSDSKTAMAWVRRKKANTKLELDNKNSILFELIERAEKWLNENKYSTKVLKWQTEIWGEIPADFGRK